MSPRLLHALLALALLAAACTYESSGTTTTTVAVVGETPVSSGPADLVFSDQRGEGSAVVIESVTLPDAGWVVVRADEGGGPGRVLGQSSLLRKGVIANVTVPFAVPLEEEQIVHASLHVDMDRDGVLSYEPPDSFVDVIASFASGEPTTVSAFVDLLPPLDPGSAALAEQRSDGTLVVGGSVTLPAPGFAALHRNDGGEPGDLLAVTGLLPEGVNADLEFVPEPALRRRQLVWLVAYVDRDEDGRFELGPDEPAVRDDGSLAALSSLITVVVDNPAAVAVEDQESELGAAVVIATASLPAAGFIEVLADDGGAPGVRLAATGLLTEGEHEAIEIVLDQPLEADAVLWVRVRIDFDEDDLLDDEDPSGRAEPGGDPAQATFQVTFFDPEAEEDA